MFYKPKNMKLIDILSELYETGEKIEQLRLELYNNTEYNREVDKEFKEDMDNILFKIQSDIKYHVVEDVADQSLIDLGWND